MRVRRGNFTVCVPLLLAAAAPLDAQSTITTYGCPAGADQIVQLNGFTAGTAAPSQICLASASGAFLATAFYTVTLKDTALGTTSVTSNVAPVSSYLIEVTIPASFYATVATPGQADPVTVAVATQIEESLEEPQVLTAPLTSTFQINPPLRAGGPVFVSAVNSPVSWTLYTGGTPPYQNESNGGLYPPGMGNLPSSGPSWSGTPNETGVYQFSMIPTDAWGNEIDANLAAYIVPTPATTGLNPPSAVEGSGTLPVTITGSGFVAPISIGSTPEPGSTVQVVFNGSPMVLTPTSVSASQLIVNIPSTLLTTLGNLLITVSNLGAATSNPQTFAIVPPALQLLTFSPLPGGVVNTAYTFTLMATGGVGSYTFSSISGTLPAGLQLSSSGVISGTPAAIGSSTFTAQVTDSGGDIASRIFSINIAPQPLMLTTGPLANTLVNTPISIQFAGSGGVPPYTFVEFGALPPGTQISSAGLLSGTPTKTGAYPFLLFINDTTGASASKNFTLNVALPGLLITPPSPLPPGQINQPYTTQLAATGGIGPPYTWSATGLPQGLNLANNSGLIDGIPRAAGSFTLGVTLGDSSGATVTQNYTLVISSANLTFTNPPFSNGAVGSSYSAALTASGGSGTYTFAASGLPPGLTLASSGTLSGTPTTAGTYSVAVTVTDSTGLTTSVSFNLTIAAKLVVTPSTIANAVVGTAISAVNLTATGGTPPYRWQSAALPPGLSLTLNGTLSGTPTAAGTFSFTVYVVDNSGALSSGAEQVTVGLPAAPSATITGLPPSTAPAAQPLLNVSLANPYPATVTANLTLTFVPVSGPDDPSIQFSTGGRTAQIVIPAGNTTGVTDVGVQTGTVAGTITITAQLLAGTVNVTPTPAPTQTIIVTAGAPVITGITATRTGTGFTVMVTGYASNRDVDSGTYQFSASAGANLLTTQLNTSITSLFTQWYGSAGSAPYGSQFTLTQPFTVGGSTSAAVLSVTVTLTNGLGTSPAATANLQ